ncbi:hypothetical protein G7076_11630 [Sphingomonas sp. HDW15A]|uniref:hypothetical protein n=1 Tax=Sphingomonas sp. HDW15A TaxID=2714942 RepID=UPI0014092602|nr:hypothetical protein [Sphingomonas sp. HDW15A]QIK96984.1 hypothetical protein G7076_11630 [Sphingomonas sp. HDW15A]
MSVLLLFLAATASPQDVSAMRRSEAATGTRATASVSVRIISGARISSSESQDAGLPLIQASSIRTEGGELRPARLVEFN